MTFPLTDGQCRHRHQTGSLPTPFSSPLLLSLSPPLHPSLSAILSSPLETKWQSTPVYRLENPMDRGAWKATVHGVAKSRTRLSDFTYSLTHLLTYLFFTLNIFSPLPSRQRRELDSFCVCSMNLFSVIIPQGSQN